MCGFKAQILPSYASGVTMNVEHPTIVLFLVWRGGGRVAAIAGAVATFLPQTRGWPRLWWGSLGELGSGGGSAQMLTFQGLASLYTTGAFQKYLTDQPTTYPHTPRYLGM